MVLSRSVLLVPFFVGISITFLLSGCPSIGKDAQTPFSYAESSIAIYNPEWDIVPVPNDLLNPVMQAKAGISVVGRTDNAPCDQCMDLRLIDDEEISKAASKGYDAPPDSELTGWLKKSSNLINGFTPDIIPELPFTKPVDMDSVIKFQEGEKSNLDKANFFFVDITDKDNPVFIEPDQYLLVFNYTQKEDLPYNLTLRRIPMTRTLPEHFDQGHSYLIVMTGGDAHGIKDTDGIAFKADGPFTMMAGKTPFIAPDGSSRMNLFDDIKDVQDLEMARLVTNYGLEIWEQSFEGKRTRDEVISAVVFTIADNPLTRYFDQVPALTYKNPLIPDYASSADYDTRAPMGFEPTFRMSRRIKASTANPNSVKLYRKIGASSYKKLAVANIETTNSETEATITIHPKDALEKGESYLVAVTGELTGENGLRAMGDIYSMLDRAPLSLIDSDGWLTQKPASPYIDIRIEALVAMINLGLTNEMEMTQTSFNHPPQSALDDSTQIYNVLLQQLENIRVDYAEPIEWLNKNGEVSNPDDLVLAYTFTMEGDEPTDGDADGNMDGDIQENCSLGADISYSPITAEELGDQNLVDVDLTGIFDLYAVFEYILLPDPIELFVTGEFTQTGNVEEGTAKLDGFLCIANVKMPLIEPAIINTDGTFTSFLPDVVVPVSLVDILEADAIGDMTMTGTVYNNTGFAGSIKAELRGAKLIDLPEVDVTLEGDFGAQRVEVAR